LGRKNEERHQGRQPQPAIQQESALRGKQQAHQNAKAEEEHRMLVFKAESSQNSEQYPPLGMVVLNGSNQSVCASGPEDRLERVHGQQVIGLEVTWRHRHRQRGQPLSESASTQRARSARRTEPL